MDGVFIMEHLIKKWMIFVEYTLIFLEYPYTFLSGLFDKPLKSGIPEPGTNQDFVVAVPLGLQHPFFDLVSTQDAAIVAQMRKSKILVQGAQNMHPKLTYVPSLKLTLAAKNGCLGNIYHIYFILGGFGPIFTVLLLFVSRVRVDFCFMDFAITVPMAQLQGWSQSHFHGQPNSCVGVAETKPPVAVGRLSSSFSVFVLFWVR